MLPFDAQIDKNKELTEESNQLGSTAEWLAVLQRTVSFELFSETFAISEYTFLLSFFFISKIFLKSNTHLLTLP